MSSVRLEHQITLCSRNKGSSQNPSRLNGRDIIGTSVRSHHEVERCKKLHSSAHSPNNTYGNLITARAEQHGQLLLPYLCPQYITKIQTIRARSRHSHAARHKTFFSGSAGRPQPSVRFGPGESSRGAPDPAINHPGDSCHREAGLLLTASFYRSHRVRECRDGEEHVPPPSVPIWNVTRRVIRRYRCGFPSRFFLVSGCKWEHLELAELLRFIGGDDFERDCAGETCAIRCHLSFYDYDKRFVTSSCSSLQVLSCVTLSVSYCRLPLGLRDFLVPGAFQFTTRFEIRVLHYETVQCPRSARLYTNCPFLSKEKPGTVVHFNVVTLQLHIFHAILFLKIQNLLQNGLQRAAR